MTPASDVPVWQRLVDTAARARWEAKAARSRTPVSYGFDDIVPSTRQWYLDDADRMLRAVLPLLADEIAAMDPVAAALAGQRAYTYAAALLRGLTGENE